MNMTIFFKVTKDIINGYVYVEKISQFLKLSMAYNMGVANFVYTQFST